MLISTVAYSMLRKIQDIILYPSREGSAKAVNSNFIKVNDLFVSFYPFVTPILSLVHVRVRRK